MYGALIDRSCSNWQAADECDTDPEGSGNCLEYYNNDFRYYMTLLAAVCKLIAFVFMLLAYKLYQLPTTNRTSPEAEEEVGVDNANFDANVAATITPPEQGI